MCSPTPRWVSRTHIRWRYSWLVGVEGEDAIAFDVAAVAAVAALDDRSRRSIYAFVATAGGPVTRARVAHAVGISRKLAAVHLDKLVRVGLLVARTDSTRTSGTRGRSPRVYERSSTDVAVTLPTRRPGDLAEMLVEAIGTAAPDETARQAAMRVAERRGRELGAATRTQVRGARIGAERALTVGESVMRERGFEPAREAPTTLRLRNCPYRPVAADAPELVCHMNERFFAGFLAGLGAGSVQAQLVPRDGACCVELRDATGPPAHSA
jgi:predicted ArsR family transcriptional regulator